VHTLRILTGLAIGLVACALAAPLPHDPGSAYAQERVAAKKKKAKKQPQPKQEQERAPFALEDQNAAVIADIPEARIWGDSGTEFQRLLPRIDGPWLAISGGGSDGAYGAGMLTGWSQSGSRPEFAMVTGVSIGSLIAPFAFLGPSHDGELRKNFTTVSAADIFEDRMTRDSLFDYWPFRRMLEERVTSKLLSEIAAEHRRGRRLLVATTNLDAGRRVVWNMGAIAERGGEKALKLFRDILLASCSIPGFFSPVAIEVEANGKKFQEFHGDGTLTAPFFVLPEVLLAADATGRPPIGDLYLIVNSKFHSEFRITDRAIAAVLGRSIDLALTNALRTQIVLMNAAAQRTGMSLRVAYVPDSFDVVSRGPFDGRFMKALFEFGVEQGKKGNPFTDSLPGLSLRKSKAAQ
jgi:hypothetical protein